jgi:hypothetical protein
MGTLNNPRWWSEEHRSAWDRVKEALRRDWEQTKSDLHLGGTDLNQDVDDTVKQAAGTQPLPVGPSVRPAATAGTFEDDWDRVEDGLRYGYGARQQYGRDHAEWNDRLEATMKEEWRDLKTGQTWEQAKAAVRRGWDRARS